MTDLKRNSRPLPEAVNRERTREFKADMSSLVFRGRLVGVSDDDLDRHARRLARDEDIQTYYRVADNWEQFRHGDVDISQALNQ